MSFERTVKQLRRELTANPKKAAVLGVMFLVAAYFWAPLVAGWFKSPSYPAAAKEPDPNADMLPQFQSNIAARLAGAPAKVEEPPQWSWQQLLAQLGQDPLKQSHAFGKDVRDPFHDVQTEPKPKAELEAPVVAKAVSTADLGLTLTSTIIGTSRRTAVINGQSYGKGDTIALGDDENSVVLKVVDIQPRRAVVQRGQERFELKLPAGPSNSVRIKVAESKHE